MKLFKLFLKTLSIKKPAIIIIIFSSYKINSCDLNKKKFNKNGQKESS